MDKVYTKWDITVRIWLGTSMVLSVGSLITLLVFEPSSFGFCLLVFIASLVASLPVLFVIPIMAGWFHGFKASAWYKMRLLLFTCFGIEFLYGVFFAFLERGYTSFNEISELFIVTGTVTGILFCSSLIAIAISYKVFFSYFTNTQINKMETTHAPETQSGKTLIKGLITGALILLLLIPTVFIQNLVKERETRQKDVAREVSSKWASSQTLSGPFLYVPYQHPSTDTQGKPIITSHYFWVLPDNLNVTGNIDHQVRPRSIYKVLLYRANIQNEGHFILNIPRDVDPNSIQWKEVKICYGLSDFKGIEERMLIKFNGTENELSPGLPKQDIATVGLSANVALTAADIGKNIPFQSGLKIKGSERLHFIPLSGNSSFTLNSKWPSPSFDGNNLPSDRNVNESGFTAKWDFNKANLPFGTVLENTSFDSNALAFGVTMLQPADQYAKTERAVKYAILIIGLTFSLFFIVEIMQKKPIHPVQYALIGMALVIFYTLLLSISEFVLFDNAYLIAAIATILLVTLYAKGHFRSWRSASVFGGVLTLLYGFIFVLIRLEDTALLVGSIGLFIILAIAMYASRNVNWYGKSTTEPAI